MYDMPCLCFDHVTEAEKRAYVPAESKLALNAGWDGDLLVVELGALMSDDFDVELTGFSIPEMTT